MCLRFVYRGNEMITGFNFDIDLAQWDHQVIEEEDRFYIGILRPDGIRHSYHGVNRSGNVGTLLYVHGNPAGACVEGPEVMTIADLTEQFIQARLSFDDVLRILKTRKIVYAPDATMQAMLSDREGRTLVIEPGIGWRLEKGRYSLMANESVLDWESTRPYRIEGDDRYQRADRILRSCGERLTVQESLELLRQVQMEGKWATRVSFVYSAGEQAVYYVQNGQFHQVKRYVFR